MSEDVDSRIGQPDLSQTYVVVAAYNEESAISGAVGELLVHFPNTIVVDDGSKDATGQRARELGVTVLRHPINLGQGAALQTGMTYAVRRGACYVATFDGDGQHDVRDLILMHEKLQESGADIALGSRFLGEAPGMPLRRKLFLRAAVLFTNLSTGVRLTDTHNGLRLMKAEAASRFRITQNGMAHASEFIDQIRRLKLRCVEVPVSIRYTPYSLGKGQRLSNALQIVTDLLSSKLAKW